MLAALFLAGCLEYVTAHAGSSLPASLLLTGGFSGPLVIGYPFVHWLTPMLLGWAWGLTLVARGTAAKPARELAIFGALALSTFALVRGTNAYGNMGLLRNGNSLVEWLHVSKYPPGISYLTLELGIMALLLSALFWLRDKRRGGPQASPRVPRGSRDPLVLLGQTPMFFYVLHFPMLELSADALGVAHKLGLGATFLGAIAVVCVLYPACRYYRTYRLAHPNGLTQFL